MGHSFSADYHHFVFGTKHRRPLIDEGLQREMFPYLAVAVRNQGYPCLIVGGRSDHVHILARVSYEVPIPDVIKEIKRTSSIWAKTKGISYGDFHWQIGYGSFSVSYSHVETVRNYIINQALHHREMTWEEEYKLLLTKHGIEFDDRDLFE